MADNTASGTTRSTGIYWRGTPVTRCNICWRQIEDRFIDGATRSGVWAIMDPQCHQIFGRGNGLGLGQTYERQADGRWLRITE